LSEVESEWMHEVRRESGSSVIAMQMGILFSTLDQNTVEKYIQVLDRWDNYIQALKFVKGLVSVGDKSFTQLQQGVEHKDRERAETLIQKVLNLLELIKEINAVLKSDGQPVLVGNDIQDIIKIIVTKNSDYWDIKNSPYSYKVWLNTDRKLEISPYASSWQQVVLDEHNTLRALHINTPALKWSEELSEKAQGWANVLATNNAWRHSPQKERDKGFDEKVGGVGENLARETYSTPTPVSNWKDWGKGRVNSWYNEIGNYNYLTGKAKSSVMVGHFTQLVWKDTQYVGCAVASSPDKKRHYLVCNYFPSGNVVFEDEDHAEKYKEKVLPKKS